MPPAPRETASSAGIATAYTIQLLNEYTHTLDSMPIDLSRNFADLRELDAVLSSSMSSVTAKVLHLTKMIETNTGSKEDRLWLLTEITEEVARLKPGGEDKIRVACLAADNLRGHLNHMKALTERIPGFDASTLSRQTTYPHVAAKSYMPANAIETGRRRRGNQGSLLTAAAAAEPSPVKRKRAAREDDLEIRSPRKEKVAETSSRSRQNGRSTNHRRGASPAESILSISAAHIQREAIPARNHHGSSRTTNGHAANSKRARTSTHRPATPALNGDHFPSPAIYDQPSTSARGGSSHRQHTAPPPPLPSTHLGHPRPHEIPPFPNVVPPEWYDEWQERPLMLEGPGMSVSRAAHIYGNGNGNGNGSSNAQIPSDPPAGNITDNATEAGDDGEGDENKPYCYCHRVSFGDMIGCDGTACEIEWFHLACVGLEGIPEGSWFCDNCKKNTRRPNRGGGKRRSTNSRARA